MSKVDPIKCGPRPRLRKWRDLPTEKLTRAERNMRFVEKYCRVPEGPLVGQAVHLAPFQERFFYALYDNKHGTRRAILSKARKNAKTATIAFIVLVHLVGPEAVQNSHIQSGARSRDQAGQVFKYARKTVELNPRLKELVRVVPSSKILVGLPANVEYQALSADAKTAHGGSPILAILDEVGQVKGPSDEFFDAITTSQGAYGLDDDGPAPILIAISTQAATDNDLLSRWIDDATKSKDPRIVCHLYAAPENCELDDRKAWEAANPAMGLFRSERDIADEAKLAMRMPSEESKFRNLYLNQRVEARDPFVSRAVWQANGDKPQPLGRKRVYGGLDLSSVSDLTALVLLSEDGDVHPTFWLPADGLKEKARADRVEYDVWHQQGFLQTTPGRAIQYEYIARQLRMVFNQHDVVRLAFDRALMRFLRPWLVKVGFTESELARFVEFGQGFISMSPALRELEARLLAHELRHGNHPVLTMCAANAVVVRDDAGNRKFTKSKAAGRIDGMVSLAMAVGASTGEDAAPAGDMAGFFSRPAYV